MQNQNQNQPQLQHWKRQRKILLGITGGIAAYKIPGLVRLIKKAGSECEVIMTESAKNFTTPMTLETLSGRKVWTDDDFGSTIPHIRLSQWAEVFVIAPCSANTLAKIAHGLADNLLTSAVLASTCPVLIFPAMNEHMYDNPATQENIRLAQAHGLKVIEPETGSLACGDDGKGRMPEPEEIMHEILRALCVQDMKGRNILVTAGPTHEYLDPVRYISNPSSGKMGVAMARSAWYRGANVKLLTGPGVHEDTYGLEVIPVVSAMEMLREVRANLEWADVIVKAAAVGDYRAKEYHEHKIKREGRDVIALELVQNPDIAAEVGRLKHEGQVLIGFAAESENVDGNARAKLARKNLDYVLANDVTGFTSDTNTLRLISRDENVPEQIFSGLKEDIAFQVWDCINAR